VPIVSRLGSIDGGSLTRRLIRWIDCCDVV